MTRTRLFALGFFLLGMALGYFAYPKFGIFESLNIPYRLGLDLAGGTHLTYQVDLSTIPSGERAETLEGLRDTIERRVNLFGVSEPLVQVSDTSGSERLLVELAGVFDIGEAIRTIGETPFMEFREGVPAPEGAGTSSEEASLAFVPTGLTGGHFSRAALEFDQFGAPYVGVEFNDEGAALFGEITNRNVGKQIAIYLDGAPISAPVVQEAITGGRAQITGNFTADEARTLVRRLNSGALRVPITLIGQQSVEASLGAVALRQTFFAGIVGILAVMLFMVLWYRLPGFMSVLALGFYIVVLLVLSKLIPITLSAAAITGFVLSVGMAVDANVLIFERMKEELRGGKTIAGAMEEGFRRAWTSIRDSNISSLMTATILYWFGTSIVRGFALTLGIGVLVSMFSAITVSRTFLYALSFRDRPFTRRLLGSGFSHS